MKTITIPVSLLHSPARSLLAARLPDFVTLTKPRVMALTVFTALVRMIIAPGHLDPLLVLNMWCDAVRTRCRPAAFLIHGAGWAANASRTTSRPSSPAAPHSR
jgi:heme o synthase